MTNPDHHFLLVFAILGFAIIAEVAIAIWVLPPREKTWKIEDEPAKDEATQ